MSADRKKKLKKKEKQSRQDERKRAILGRLSRVMGLNSVFDRLPAPMIDIFLKKIGPAIEVVTDQESSSHPEIQEAIREITPLIKQPLVGDVNGRRFVLAFEDMYRAYYSITEGIDFFFECVRRLNDQSSRRLLTVLEEARVILQDLDEDWFYNVVGTVASLLADATERNFRVDGPIIEARMDLCHQSDGRDRHCLRLRLHEPELKIAIDQGSRWPTYLCRSADFLDDLRVVTWNCKEVGIEGPNCDLRVLIEKHAIEQLHERLPLFGFERFLHKAMVQALESPVLIPVIPNRPHAHLVEFRLGGDRLGYFVAEIHPAFILIKMFLFLTMRGTPESKLLGEKLGLYRADVEHYKLDDFFTIVGSDIAKDALLHRVLSECGCGHLLNVIDPHLGLPWIDTFGEKFKKTFRIAEAPEGFFAGQKWNKWSN